MFIFINSYEFLFYEALFLYIKLSLRSMSETPVLLIIDNILHVLASRGRVFRHCGNNVALASGESEAMDVLRNQPVFAIIVDYRILSMDGQATLKKFRRLYPDTVIVMLNEGNEAKNINHLIKENVFEKYFERPFENSQLLDFISESFNTYQLKTE